MSLAVGRSKLVGALKDLMVKVRPAFVAHLEHAKMLQSQLGK